MNEREEMEYGNFLRHSLDGVEKCIASGNLVGLERVSKDIYDALMDVGKAYYGSTWKPSPRNFNGKRPLDHVIVDMIFERSVFDEHGFQIDDREESLNKLIWEYTPGSPAYIQRMHAASANKDSQEYSRQLSENERWAEKFDSKSKKSLSGFDHPTKRLKLLEAAVKKHSERGDVRRFEQVSRLIVEMAKLEEDRLKSLGSFSMSERNNYSKWAESYAPGSPRYDILREIAGQNQYKMGIPPEIFPEDELRD